MPHAYPKHLRTARIIQEIIAPLLTHAIPSCLLTVRGVEVSVDRRHATIYYTVLAKDPQDIHEQLQAQLGQLRSNLARSMYARRVPELSLLQVPMDTAGLPCMAS